MGLLARRLCRRTPSSCTDTSEGSQDSAEIYAMSLHLVWGWLLSDLGSILNEIKSHHRISVISTG